MYYLFHSNIIEWKNRLLQAQIIGRTAPYHRMQERWWSEGTLEPQVPIFKFKINADDPKLDNYWTGTLIELYSETLISAISQYPVKCQVFPAELYGVKTKQLITDRYKVFRLFEFRDALEPNRSEYIEISTPGLPVTMLRRLTLRNEIMDKMVPMARIAGHANLVLIHQEVKDAFDQSGITGCDYTPLIDGSVELDVL